MTDLKDADRRPQGSRLRWVGRTSDADDSRPVLFRGGSVVKLSNSVTGSEIAICREIMDFSQ
jgi:hypothetical protein